MVPNASELQKLSEERLYYLLKYPSRDATVVPSAPKNSKTGGQRMKRRTSSISILALAILVTTLAVTPTSANNFSGATGKTGCDDLNMADSNPLTYINIEISTKTATALSYTYKHLKDDTDVTTLKVDGITSETDQINRDQYYTTYCDFEWLRDGVKQGVVGHVKCNSVNSAKKCKSHTARFNKYFTDNATTSRMRNLTTHETGHVLGLKHRKTSTSLLMYPEANTTTVYSAHDIEHLDSNY